MPIIVPKDIPAAKILQSENIFIMNDKRAMSQDIRPLEIAILNLMPTKIVTETQLMRLLIIIQKTNFLIFFINMVKISLLEILLKK